MWLTGLGCCGAYPEADQACSGYLVEHDGFRLLVGLGYAVVPQLLRQRTAGGVDAVFISHGHPDHCADLNPLLRARVLGGDKLPPLPVCASFDCSGRDRGALARVHTHHPTQPNPARKPLTLSPVWSAGRLRGRCLSAS